MKCARSWEAAARNDGRLAASDRASFERHVDTCAECRREIAELKSLSAVLERAVPPPPTPLEHQRARGKLLASANAASTISKESSRGLVFALAAGLLLATGAVVAYRQHTNTEIVATNDRVTQPIAPPALPAVSPPDIEVTAPPPSAAPVRVKEMPVHRPRTEPGPAFADAFASFEQGSYGISDLKFERFMRDFPSDPRAEDAAYLRSVARLRMGDREGAAALARSYIDGFPAGLRRPEAQRIADNAQ